MLFRSLQKRFGIIEGITDKNYITNSYHIHVTENINAFDKLAFESQFQALSPGGAISYVEVPNMQQNIDYSLYGTPLESTTYKFAKCLQKRFGIIEGVTDKGYITNSYHVHVTEPIDAFTKLKFEAQFQHLSPGGAISYVEVPNMQNNLEAVLQVMKFIYDNIIYAELNTKSDYCQVCGWDGEIEIVEDGGKLIWRCPKCGNTDQDKMNVARRTCGYIGTQFWNQGRTQEIKERVLHL